MKFRDPSSLSFLLCKSSHSRARVLTFGLAMLAGVPWVQAQSITYTKIADVSTAAPGAASNFSSFNSVNLDGNNLVFMGAFNNNGSSGIYTSTVSGLSLTRILDNSTIPTDSGASMGSALTSFQTPIISGGNLAFKGTLANGANGIYSASVGTLGASLVTQANDAAPEAHEKFSLLFAPAVSGTKVGFFSNIVDDGTGGISASGLYLGTAGQHATPTMLIDRPTTLNGHSISNFGNAVSMDGNMVTFRANYSGGNAIYSEKTDGTSLTLIADTSTQLPDHSGTFSLGLSVPSISGSNVAFATLGGVYLSDATGLHTIADGNTFVPGLSGVKFSSTGFTTSAVSVDGENVAFSAAYDGGSGIFVEYNGNLLPVVTTTSNLFGDPVYFYSLSNEALDGDHLAFEYLVNGSSGTTGVAVANIGVPEPSVVTSLLGGLGLFAMGRRRKKA